MRRGELLLVLVVVVCPSCVGPSRTSDSNTPFAPKHMYTKRVPRAPQPRLSHSTRPSQPLPRRDLTARRPQRTWYPRGRRVSDRWTTIVIHHSGTDRGSAVSFDKNHREERGWESLGYHFVIGNGTDTPNGKVEAGLRWHEQKHGAHCQSPGNYFNDHGIGICLVGDFTKSRPTKKQLRALDELVRFLSKTCSIPPSRVTTHKHINRTTKCPGQYFALEPVRRHLAKNPASRPTALVSQRRTRQLGAR